MKHIYDIEITQNNRNNTVQAVKTANTVSYIERQRHSNNDKTNRNCPQGFYFVVVLRPEVMCPVCLEPRRDNKMCMSKSRQCVRVCVSVCVLRHGAAEDSMCGFSLSRHHQCGG